MFRDNIVVRPTVLPAAFSHQYADAGALEKGQTGASPARAIIEI